MIDTNDPTLRMLSHLPAAAPDASRVEGTLVRCRADWERKARAIDRRASRRRLLGTILVGGFSLAYVAALVFDLLRWHGAL